MLVQKSFSVLTSFRREHCLPSGGFFSIVFFFFSNQFELKLSDINTYSYCTEYVLYNGLKKIIQRNISFKLLIIFFISLLKVKDTGILDSVTPQERKRQEVRVCVLT